MIKQFKKLSKNTHLKEVLVSMLNELEDKGPSIGKLLDSQLHLYELKRGNPSLRIYYRPHKVSNKIDIFEYEIKKRRKQQKRTIKRIKRKISKA
jgi:hypothetical protein